MALEEIKIYIYLLKKKGEVKNAHTTAGEVFLLLPENLESMSFLKAPSLMEQNKKRTSQHGRRQK